MLTEIGAAITGDGQFGDWRSSAWCSSSSASPSRSAPCRSTRGRPTPTRVRRRRSPRSCRWRRRRPASSRSGARRVRRLPAGRRRVRAVHLGAGGADDDGRQRARAAPDQHRAHAGVLEHQPGRVHPDAAGVVAGDAASRSRRCKAVVIYLLIYAVHEPRRVRRRHRRRPQDPQRRDLALRRAVQLRARPRPC